MDKVKIVVAALIVVGALVGYYQWPDTSVFLRTAAIFAAFGVGAGIALTTSYGREFVAFSRGTLNEVRRVIWPTRRETIQATMVVIVMVLVIGLYIWLLDTLAFWAVYDLILNVRG